jgi:hypothetical protein
MEKHVFIIESPRPTEILLGQTEGEALDRVLSLAQVNHKLYRVVSEDTLDLCLADMADRCDATKGVPLVIIHLSMHGNEDGIGLTSGQSLSWDDLRDKLMMFANRANLVTQEKALLVLCFATCFGLSGRKMNEGRSKSCFLALVGAREKINLPDALTAFVVFYHGAFDRAGTDECVRRMNEAIGRPNLFEVIDG